SSRPKPRPKGGLNSLSKIADAASGKLWSATPSHDAAVPVQRYWDPATGLPIENYQLMLYALGFQGASELPEVEVLMAESRANGGPF
ncbi:hypothetical protein, partial [Amorphus sp. MBR-141]